MKNDHNNYTTNSGYLLDNSLNKYSKQNSFSKI